MAEPREDEIERVRRTAALARIDVPPAELPALARDLERILDAFRILQSVDVAGIEPLVHATELADVTRPDRPRPSLERERLLDKAPERAAEFFRVPKTVGGEP